MSTDPNSNKLRFREPGSRDTVLKVSPTGASATPKKNTSPLFLKIRDTLTNSDPAKWDKYGEDLKSDVKHPKSYDKWDIAYCIDLPNGLLTFRSSQNVISEYFGGGYTLKPDGIITYFIELRPRSWDPRTLIDPFFRSTLEKDKQYKPLADGEVAKELYELIENTYVNFSSQKKRGITESIQHLANNIIQIATEGEIAQWQRNESQENKVSFTATINEVNAEIIRTKRLDLFAYELILSRDTVSSQIKDPTLAKDLFNLLEDKTKNAALEALQDVLDEAGF